MSGEAEHFGVPFRTKSGWYKDTPHAARTAPPAATPEPVADDRARVIAEVLEAIEGCRFDSVGTEYGDGWQTALTRAAEAVAELVPDAQRAAADPFREAIRALADEHERMVTPAPYTTERALIERLRNLLGDQP